MFGRRNALLIVAKNYLCNGKGPKGDYSLYFGFTKYAENS